MSKRTITGNDTVTAPGRITATGFMPSGSVQRLLGSLLILLCLASCAARTVNVEGSYPRPNIPAIPMVLGVYYGEGLRILCIPSLVTGVRKSIWLPPVTPMKCCLTPFCPPCLSALWCLIRWKRLPRKVLMLCLSRASMNFSWACHKKPA